ncbi:hypothetical protein [Spirochaeta lutea]|uniref:Uncharacterized protein n=1 Tax=Spirochaeta lutea TaxID=1480694 RepID=A0A098QVP6_9SPIO|nr:hypothetical protein [Spirochaeta lutea]KGE71651.1 hypothetical protein DC28_10310 [Spirochaeta lutea]
MKTQTPKRRPPSWILLLLFLLGTALIWSSLLGPLSTMSQAMPVDRGLQIILNILATLGLGLLLLLYRRLR